MSQKALMKILGDRPIAYHPILAKITGSVKAGILLSQLCYWQDRTDDPEGWFFKTREELQGETGLSREEQDAARRALKKLQITEEVRRRVPPKVHYRVDVERIQQLLEDDANDNPNLRETHKLNGGKPTNQDEGNPQINSRESLNTNGGKASTRDAGNPQNQEGTETTQRVRREESPRRSAASEGLRDPVWDAFVGEIKREPATKRERDRWNGNAKQVREALGAEWGFDLPAALDPKNPLYARVRMEVRRRARRWRERYPDAHLTDNAFALRWGELGDPVSAPSFEDETLGPATATEPDRSPADQVRARIAMARAFVRRKATGSRIWSPVDCPDCEERLETYQSAATHPEHTLAEAAGG